MVPVKLFIKWPHPRSFPQADGPLLKNAFHTQSPFSFGEGMGMRPN